MSAPTVDVPSLSLVPSEEEIAIRASVRAICEKYGDNYGRKCYDEGRSPTEVWDGLAEAGFAGINVPVEWGGGGMGMAGLAIVGEEASAAGHPMLMLVVSSAITGSILEKHATDEQKERWLRGIGAGTTKFSFAITEPDAGSNSHNLGTTLTPTADGSFRLKGQKTFISGVELADGILVVARHRDPDGTLGAPSLCIIDVDTPGLRRTVIPMPYLGPESQWQLFFDDIEVSAENVIGAPGAGLAAVFDGLNPERIMVGALSTGLAMRALDKACDYARERTVWKTPIGAHQGIAHPLAKAKIEVEMTRLMTQKACALVDAGHPAAGEASNYAKFAAGESATHAVDAAIQTHGGNGVALEYGISDLYWFSRLMRIAPVSAEMILNFVAQHTLELPRSY